MEYTRLGSTGLKVSRVCLGCMSYGLPTESNPWVLNEEQSRPYIKRALEAGINFFDTSNVYGYGHSERLIGRVFSRRRSEVVMSTSRLVAKPRRKRKAENFLREVFVYIARPADARAASSATRRRTRLPCPRPIPGPESPRRRSVPCSDLVRTFAPTRRRTRSPRRPRRRPARAPARPAHGRESDRRADARYRGSPRRSAR